MRTKTVIILIQTFFISNLFSQEKTDIELLKENTYYFEIEQNKPKGVGFDIIKKEIENVQFVILGEEHFSAKISEFTNAIVYLLTKNQFKYFAAEIGPNSANEMLNTLKKENSLYSFNTKVNNLVNEIPFPFFDGIEDEVFLKSFLKNNFEVWGIDQEYLTSQVFLIDRLYQLSNKSKNTKTNYKNAKKFIISETKKRYQDRKYKAFTSLLNSSEINLFFDILNDKNIKSQKIISDLKKSWEVYKLREDKDFYGSLHKRQNIMQENFINYYNTALQKEKLPKVFYENRRSSRLKREKS